LLSPSCTRCLSPVKGKLHEKGYGRRVKKRGKGLERREQADRNIRRDGR
jgi:hypothetical protein